MKVIATSDDASYFLENPEEELDIIDDCYPFILTNIHGPIRIENDKLSFMDEVEFSIHQPNGKLSLIFLSFVNFFGICFVKCNKCITFAT